MGAHVEQLQVIVKGLLPWLEDAIFSSGIQTSFCPMDQFLSSKPVSKLFSNF